MSHYRVDYASASPRSLCAKCSLLIRSGELRFCMYDTSRHIDCVSSLEVLKLWQTCKSFESLPGFSQLEAADRSAVQVLFKTLLLSTPMHARSKMAQAAAAASAASERTSSHAAAAQFHHLHAPYREPSNDASMMAESPPVAVGGGMSSASPALSASASRAMDNSVSPLIEPLFPFGRNSNVSPMPNAAGSASSSALPQIQPQLQATPSALAGYMSTLSCSTPTNGMHTGGALQAPGSGSSNHGGWNGSAAASASASGLLSPPPALAASSSSSSAQHRPFARDGGGAVSSHSSPALQPRSHHIPSHHGHSSSFDARALSPFGAGSGTASSGFTLGTGLAFVQHPPSPHSNHTSPVPFSQLHLSGATGNPFSRDLNAQFQGSATPASASAASAGSAAAGTTASAAAAGGRKSKRKLDSCIPEEEASDEVLPFAAAAPAGASMSSLLFSPVAQSASSAASASSSSSAADRDRDEMVDESRSNGGGGMEDEHSSGGGGGGNSKRRRKTAEEEQSQQQQQQQRGQQQQQQSHAMMQQQQQHQPAQMQAQSSFPSHQSQMQQLLHAQQQQQQHQPHSSLHFARQPQPQQQQHVPFNPLAQLWTGASMQAAHLPAAHAASSNHAAHRPMQPMQHQPAYAPTAL